MERLTADTLRALPSGKREEALNALGPEGRLRLLYNWKFWARDNQLPPGQWGKDGCYIWNIRAGRGYGKTRTGAETLISLIQTGKYKYTSICGATAEEVRDVMINGDSGIKVRCPPWFMPDYKPSIKKIFWPNGGVTSIFYGSEPEKSRGSQACAIWMDECNKWSYPEETFDNLILGLRLGDNPLAIVTSTPKPTKFCRDLESKKTADGRPAVVTTLGTTFDNKANLSPIFYSSIIAKYQNSRLGLQELNAEILDDNPNALFHREILIRDQVEAPPPNNAISRVIVAVDPAITSNKDTSDHTGIVALCEGKAPEALASRAEVQHRDKKHYYILGDYSCIGTPNVWAARVKMAVVNHEAGRIFAESNQGGEMIAAVMKNAGVGVPIQLVRSVRDKATRAGATSLISSQGRLHFVKNGDGIIGGDTLDLLMDQCCNWIPGDTEDSPDRLDALVIGVNALNGTSGGGQAAVKPLGL